MNLRTLLSVALSLCLGGCSAFNLFDAPDVDFAVVSCRQDVDCVGLSYRVANSEYEENSCIVIAPFCDTQRGTCDVRMSTRDSDGDGARDLDPNEMDGTAATTPAGPCQSSPFEPTIPDCPGGDRDPALTPFDNDGDGRYGMCAAKTLGFDCDDLDLSKPGAKAVCDCDDDNPSTYPGAAAVCDGFVNDCFAPDGGARIPEEDADGDGHGVEATTCDLEATLAEGLRLDCDDTNPAVYPGAPELCDGVHNSCSGLTGANDAEDGDGDGYPSARAAELTSCVPIDGRAIDCDDSSAAVFPGAPELCDGIFNDCTAGIGPRPAEDRDGDGFSPYEGACVLRPREPGECAGADFDPATRFCLPREESAFGSIILPQRVAMGDLDLDGHAEAIVIANGKLWVYQGTASGFAGGTPLVDQNDAQVSIVGTVKGFVLADFSGDEYPEILIASGNTYRWIDNTDGSLAPRLTTNPASGAIEAIVVADLNGNGFADVVAAEENSGVRIVIDDAWPGAVLAGTQNVTSVAAGDFDGDGDADLALRSTAGVAFWANDGASDPVWTQTGTASMPADVPMDGLLAAGDVDGDGVDDLVVSAGRSSATPGLHWLRPEVVGDLAAETLIADAIDAAFAGADDLEVVDLDADGAAEIVVAIGGAHTLAYYGRHEDGFARFDLATDLRGVTDVAAADADGDGDLDLLCAAGPANAVAFFRSSFTSPVTWSERSIDRAFFEAGDLLAADLDADGFVDVIGSSSEQLVVWRSVDGSGTRFQERSIASLGGDATSVTVADVDADGDLDILAVSNGKALWFENDDAVFHEHVLIQDEDALALTIAPRDGGVDVAVLTATSVVYHRNRGESPVAFDGSTAASGLSGATALVVGDFSADGSPDIAVATAGPSVQVFLAEGAGFVAQTSHALTIVGATTLVAAHFDGDDHLDLAVSSEPSDGIDILYGDGTGAFVAGTTPPAGGGAHLLRAVDVDRDGDMDLVGATNGGGKLVFWQNTADRVPGAWIYRSIVETFSNARGVAVGDVDGDGWPDVIGSSRTLSRVRWWANGGETWWAP